MSVPLPAHDLRGGGSPAPRGGADRIGGVALWVTGALSAALLVATNMITHERTPEMVTWIFSSPLTLAGFFALFGLPSLLLALHTFWQIVMKFRRREFGGQLSLVLASILAAMALVPALLVYQSSAAAILRNIDSWFGVQLDEVFDEGLEVAQRQIGRSFEEIEGEAREIARRLNVFERLDLRQLALERGLEDIEVIAGQNRPSGGLSSGDSAEPQDGFFGDPALPGRRLVKRFYEGYLLEVTVPILSDSRGLSQDSLRVSAQMPIWLDRSVENLSKGKAELNRLQSLRATLKTTFIWALSVSTLVVLCLAVTLAGKIGEALSQPLSNLALALEAVARRDFRNRPSVRGGGDMATLVKAFNSMSDQLEQALRNEKDKQDELASSNIYLESLLGNLSAGVVELDPEHKAKRVNTSACDLLGAPAVGLMGKPPAEWPRAGDHLRQFSDAVREKVESLEEDATAEIKVRDRRLAVRFRRMPKEAQSAFVVLIDDITAQLEASEEKALEQALERFAHEIKNPLTPILLAAESIERKISKGDAADGEVAQKISANARAIMTEVRHMSGLVDQYRQDVLLQRTEFVPLDLNECVSEALTIYRYKEKGVFMDLAKEDPVIRGSAGYIRQLLKNLVNNSIEAVQGGKAVMIDIRTECQDNHASIIVQDNCGGMAERTLAEAFKSKTSTKPKGTGLGLMYAKSFVEKMGGAISLSNAGEGLRVVVRLPLHHG